MNVTENPRQAMWPTYAPPAELVFTHGEGSWLFDEAGDAYLDFVTGIAVTGFGHAHPHLVHALNEQAQKVWHLSNLVRIPQAERLAKRLCDISFGDAVFFTNSGTEAVEAGLKAMRAYHAKQGNSERYRILSFSGSFHGRTLGAIAASGNPAYCNGFIPMDYGFTQLPYGDEAELLTAIDSSVAGIIIEPVQGEGGIRPAEKAWLQKIRQLCDEHGILLMYDEVQCGMGRTGHPFAHQAMGVEPDVMALAKGIGGGFPLGACLANDKVAQFMQPGTHGSTYGGNPLAASVGNAVLDLMLEPELLPSVQEKSNWLMKELKALCELYPEVIKGVTGTGLMIGIQCEVENIKLLAALRDEKLLVGRCGGNMIRLLPPLNVSQDELEQALVKMSAVLERLRGS